MNYQELKTKSDTELETLVITAREELRLERVKPRDTKKASIIRAAKQTIAQALTELHARRLASTTK